METTEYNRMIEYAPPEWCRKLKVMPKFRIQLAMTPTPIHEWKIKDIPENFQLFVKRDDLTGCSLSGNKVRKLEFLLADAKAKGCKSVITRGSTQSNHARSTLIAAKQVGIDCHLILRDINENCTTTVPSGNFLLMESSNPNIYLLPCTPFNYEQALAKQNVLRNHIRKTTGNEPYCIPPGGDTEIGVYGYIQAWEEMMQQKIDGNFDDVVVATGTSGTICGLAIGNYLTGSKLKLHGILVSHEEEMVHNLINEKLRIFGLDARSQDVVDIIEGHAGGGYNVFTKEEIAYYLEIAKTTGIYCDPVYVGKAIKGLMDELKNNPKRFKGERILFIHTGKRRHIWNDGHKQCTVYRRAGKIKSNQTMERSISRRRLKNFHFISSF
uniref:putative D-cysteine desulfhydrase 1, mitochondrial isoform X1 n=1 Tax=Styela clava TaxID=7725 RepID=UPI001939FB2F|nr:putative D-cysteine desulfhydrase 1, mitochondrial isoform X1 [Styela clava]